MYSDAYETGDVRELALEGQVYVNESRHEAEAVDRAAEVIVTLNETADYYQDVVALHGLYKRAFFIKNGEAKRFLDNRPFLGISDGFMVADFRTSFDDIPDTPRQRTLLSEMEEFTDGHYVVCHRVKTGDGRSISTDGLVVADISAFTMAPIGTSAVFPEKPHALDELLTEERQQEAERIISSAGPFYKETLEKIEMDLSHEDVIKGLIYAARKFRGMCEHGDDIVKAAALARISALTLDRLDEQVVMLSGNLPMSLMVKNNLVVPASLSKQSHYVFAPERLATAPYYKQPELGGHPVYEESHALYLLGRLLDESGETSDPLLLPLEHMHETEIIKAIRPHAPQSNDGLTINIAA